MTPEPNPFPSHRNIHISPIEIHTTYLRVVRIYPYDWIVAASIPFMLWLFVYAMLWTKTRGGQYRLGVNLPSFLGAVLALVSFSIGWEVVKSGYDWQTAGGYSILLLFTYPLALVTPLAGLGQVGVLLWILAPVYERSASIEPMYGYLIAWISAFLMVAGIIWPVGYPRGKGRPALADRTLTLTWRRTKGQWMPHERGVMLMYVVSAVTVGAVCMATNAPFGAYAVLLIGFIFAWLLQSRVARGESASIEAESLFAQKNRECPDRGTDSVLDATRRIAYGAKLETDRAGRSTPSSDAGEGGTRWVLFVALAYSALVVTVETVSRAFGPGFSGEEKTAGLLLGLGILAILSPLGIITWRLATPPCLPRRLVLASMSAFGLFMLMAAISMTHLDFVQGSSRGYLLLAGVALAGPAWFHLRTGFKIGTHGGSHSEDLA